MMADLDVQPRPHMRDRQKHQKRQANATHLLFSASSQNQGTLKAECNVLWSSGSLSYIGLHQSELEPR